MNQTTPKLVLGWLGAMVVFAWATVTSAQPAVPSSGPTQPRGPGFGAPQRPPPKAIYPDVKPVLTIDQLKSVAIAVSYTHLRAHET